MAAAESDGEERCIDCMARAPGEEWFDPNPSEARERNKEVTSFTTSVMFLRCGRCLFYCSTVFHRILSLQQRVSALLMRRA